MLFKKGPLLLKVAQWSLRVGSCLITSDLPDSILGSVLTNIIEHWVVDKLFRSIFEILMSSMRDVTKI